MRDIVGISFKEYKPVRIPLLDSKDKHCHFIGEARTREAFYIPKENINCPLARFYLGIEKSDLKELSSILVTWNDAVSREVGMNYLKTAIIIEHPKNYIVYFSYPEYDLKPDIIVKVGDSEETQILLQRFSSLTGKRVNASLSGIGAACGEYTAYPYVTGKINVSVGCYGSRPRVNLKEEELFLACPYNSEMRQIILERF